MEYNMVCHDGIDGSLDCMTVLQLKSCSLLAPDAIGRKTGQTPVEIPMQTIDPRGSHADA